MGFFSDLKEDLSLAVSELLPTEPKPKEEDDTKIEELIELQQEVHQEVNVVEALNDDVAEELHVDIVETIAAEDVKEEFPDDFEIDKLLERVEFIELSEEMKASFLGEESAAPIMETNQPEESLTEEAQESLEDMLKRELLLLAEEEVITEEAITEEAITEEAITEEEPSVEAVEELIVESEEELEEETIVEAIEDLIVESEEELEEETIVEAKEELIVEPEEELEEETIVEAIEDLIVESEEELEEETIVEAKEELIVEPEEETVEEETIVEAIEELIIEEEQEIDVESIIPNPDSTFVFEEISFNSDILNATNEKTIEKSQEDIIIEDVAITEPIQDAFKETVFNEEASFEPMFDAIEEIKEEHFESEDLTVITEELNVNELLIEEELNQFGENNTTEEGIFKTMDAMENRELLDETAVITQGMTINGDIISGGSVDVTGTINGNIDILGKLNVTGNVIGNSKAAEIYADGAKITGEVESEGSVKIGQSTIIIGNITATSAVVAGAVKGDIDVRGPVILDTSAIVMGNIKSKSVQINNGAVIEGMCSQCYADVNPTSFFEEFKKNIK